jgi:hypothetical protein
VWVLCTQSSRYTSPKNSISPWHITQPVVLKQKIAVSNKPPRVREGPQQQTTTGVSKAERKRQDTHFSRVPYENEENVASRLQSLREEVIKTNTPISENWEKFMGSSVEIPDAVLHGTRDPY